MKWLARAAGLLAVCLLLSALLIACAGPSDGLVESTESSDTAELSATPLPMYRGNPARTGEYPGLGVSGPPVFMWAFETGGFVYSSPVVSNGMAYFGSWDQNVYAVDALTGEEEWRFETAGRVDSSPAVVDGVVYFGSCDDNLYAVDARTGEEEWRFETADNVLSSPGVVDGVVYFGSDDGNLYAIDALTGNEIWVFESEGSIDGSPAVVDGVVYVGSNDGNFYAIDAQTGLQRWKYATHAYGYGSPAVLDGVVYFGSNAGKLFAVDAQTGERRWSLNADRRETPGVADGAVYLTDSGDLFAVDAQTGEESWRFAAEGGAGIPIVSGDAVCSGYYGLHAVDAVTGATMWTYDTEMLTTPPVIADGVIYYGQWDPLSNGSFPYSLCALASTDYADYAEAAAATTTTSTTLLQAPSLVLSGFEQVEVDSVCVLVEDSYRSIKDGPSPDFVGMAEDALKGMGLAIVALEEEPDVTLTFVVQGRALSSTYTPEGGGASVRLYTGASISGTVELAAPAVGKESWKVSGKQEPEWLVFSYTQKDPADAPFEDAFKGPLLESLGRVWGTEDAVLGILRGCGEDWWLKFWDGDNSRWVDDRRSKIIGALLDSRLDRGLGVAAKAYPALGWCLSTSNVPRGSKRAIVRALISDIGSDDSYRAAKAREALEYVLDTAADIKECDSWDAEEWTDWADNNGY